jgi:GTP pyrophosphokinase
MCSLIFGIFYYTIFMPHATQHIDAKTMMEDILGRYEKYGDVAALPQIRSAYEYAKKAHEGILRKSGDEYVVHPVSAAQELMILEPDSTTIIATLLHDVVSHGESSYAEIGTQF